MTWASATHSRRTDCNHRLTNRPPNAPPAAPPLLLPSRRTRIMADRSLSSLFSYPPRSSPWPSLRRALGRGGRCATRGRRPIRVRRRCGGRRDRTRAPDRRRSIGASGGRRRSCRTPRWAVGRCVMDADRLAFLVVDEIQLGQAHEDGLAVAHFVLRLDAAADDLLGRDAVDLLGPRAHELDAAAGDDEGLEAVGAQVGEHFEHRLIDHLGDRAGRSSGCFAVAIQSLTIFSNSSVVMPACVAMAISSSACSPPARADFTSPFSTEANGSLVFHSGCCGASCLIRSKMKNAWKYIGCSDQRQPSLSKVAMRSAGGDEVRRPGPRSPSSRSRRSPVLAARSFHEATGRRHACL